jgi:hypothetical protein
VGRLQELVARGRIEPPLLLQESARGARDGGEGRAQIVRDRAEQGVPEPLGLDLELRLLGLLGEEGTLQRQGGLAGKGFEQSALLWGQDTTRLGWQHP